MNRSIPDAARGSSTSLARAGHQSPARSPDDAGADRPPTGSSLAATAPSSIAREQTEGDPADHGLVEALHPAPPRTAGAT
jgi:hypothetical protein